MGTAGPAPHALSPKETETAALWLRCWYLWTSPRTSPLYKYCRETTAASLGQSQRLGRARLCGASGQV